MEYGNTKYLSIIGSYSTSENIMNREGTYINMKKNEYILSIVITFKDICYMDYQYF